MGARTKLAYWKVASTFAVLISLNAADEFGGGAAALILLALEIAAILGVRYERNRRRGIQQPLVRTPASYARFKRQQYRKHGRKNTVTGTGCGRRSVTACSRELWFSA